MILSTCVTKLVRTFIRKCEKHLFLTYSVIITCYSHYIIQVQLLMSWKGLNGRRLVRIRSNKMNKMNKTMTHLLMLEISDLVFIFEFITTSLLSH